MGSGTTAVSALKTERKFVGYEISNDYIKLAEKRIEPIIKQTKLSFDYSNIKESAKPPNI